MLRLPALAVVAALAVSAPHAQTTFTVTTDDDAGAGSLRQAILDANATPGPDAIAFDIPGASPHRIRPETPLPALTDPITIDGLTQPGASCDTWPATLRVEIDGSRAPDGASGLHLVAGSDGSTVRGLAVHSFQSNPASGMIGVLIDQSDGNIVECLYVGTDLSGTAPRPNLVGLFVLDASGNRIGGPGVGQRNLLSANATHNLAVRGLDAARAPTANVVQGNYIGTDVTGTSVFPRPAVFSVNIGGSTETRIGGTAPGAGNVIAGGEIHGLVIQSVVADGVPTTGAVVQGNRIGTNAAGTAALPNGNYGVFVVNASGTRIGGPEEGARNLIGGHAIGGVGVGLGEQGQPASGTRIENNWIGTDASGLAPLGNAAVGVFLFGSAAADLSGTEVVGNVVSGNGRGISVFPGAPGTVIQGNRIGVGADGRTPLGNVSLGVELRSVGALVGGRTAAERNVIGANGWAGVAVREPTATGNRIEGNHLGVGADGVTPLGQVPVDGQPGMGVTLIEGAAGNVVGGDAPGAANTIAFNDGPGVQIADAGTLANALRRNAVFQNAGAGIELGRGGTPDDADDADDGPNRLQNAPALVAASGDGATLTVTYAVASDAAHSAYPLTVEIFLADADGAEGAAFLGAAVYTAADAGAEATAAFAPARSVADGALILATATDADGNTSQFGSAVAVVGSAVDAEADAGGRGLWLSDGAPNPSGGAVGFALRIDRAHPVAVAAFDALGRRVAVLHDGPLGPGTHRLAFDAGGLPVGVYVVRAVGDGDRVARRVTVVR